MSKAFPFQVKKVEFLEAHTVSAWQSRGVFQYLVLLHTQASGARAKVTLLDAVERFRAGNMSGYVTVYSDISSRLCGNSLAWV